jgi:hypothetical protein
MSARLLLLSSAVFFSCGGASTTDAGTVDAGTLTGDAGTSDPFVGTWRLGGPIGTTNFTFPLHVVAASDGNYRGEYAGCTIPLAKSSATHLTGVGANCTVTAAQLQDSTYYGGNAPQFGNPIMLVFESGTDVSVIADVMTATGAFTAQNSRVPFTMSGSRQ